MPAGGIGHSVKASATERGKVDNDEVANLSVRIAGGGVGTITCARIAPHPRNRPGHVRWHHHMRADSAGGAERSGH